MRAKGRPTAAEQRRRIEALCLRTTEAGLPLTDARRAVLEAVVLLDAHPTADEVHAFASERLPGLGRATVYRTLERLVGLGVLDKALHGGAAVRYDAVTRRHHHLVCTLCDGIVDLYDERLDAVPVPDTSPLGFEVSDVQVQIRGICRACREHLGQQSG